MRDRIVMMHRRQVLHDLQGPERARVRPEDLLERFDEVRRHEQLDATVAKCCSAITSDRNYPNRFYLVRWPWEVVERASFSASPRSSP